MNLQEFLSRPIANPSEAGTVFSKNATAAMPRLNTMEDLRLSHELTPQGAIIVTRKADAGNLETGRRLAASMTPLDDQEQVAAAFCSETAVQRAVAAVLEVKNAPTSQIAPKTLRITRQTCYQFAEHLLGSGLSAAAHELTANIFASLNHELEYFHDHQSVETFLRPLQLENQLTDPFSTAVELYMIKHTPFGTIEYDRDAMKKVHRKSAKAADHKRMISFIDYCSYISRSMRPILPSFSTLFNTVQNTVAGMHILGEVHHGRLNLPFALNESIYKTLSTDIVWHRLTMSVNEDRKLWAVASNKRVLELKSALATLINEDDSPDHIQQQATVDLRPTDFQACMNAMETVFNEFVEFVDVHQFRNILGWRRHVTTDDNDTIAAISLQVNVEHVHSLEAYSGLVLNELIGASPAQVGTLMQQVGTIGLPVVDDTHISDAFMQIASSLSKGEVSQWVSDILSSNKEGTGTKYVSFLPGTSVPVVSNIFNLQNASVVTTAGPNNYDAGTVEIPQMLYLAFASLATEFVFSPNTPIEFVKKVEPGNKFALCHSQISPASMLDRENFSTVNPAELLLVHEIATTSPSTSLSVTDPVIDLNRLVGKEFINPIDPDNKPYQIGSNASSPIIECVMTRLPYDSTRRKTLSTQLLSYRAKHGNEINGKALKDAGLDESDLAIPVLSYEKRQKRKGDRVTRVSAPIDLAGLFGNKRVVYVSSVRSIKGLDQRINDYLDGIKALDFSDHAKLAQKQLRIDFLRDLIAPYKRPMLRRTDINGLGNDPTATELYEFVIHHALHTALNVLELVSQITPATKQRVVDMVNIIELVEFQELAQGLLPAAATDLGL
jgi:hypothetical protein